MPSGRVMPSSASRMRRAARTARSGSSSCTAGTPKTPTTASPMNFSTVPPWDSIDLRGTGEVVAEDAVDVLGVGGLAHGCEGDEVAEERGDDLALLRDGNGGSHRGRALHAESGAARIVSATRRTRDDVTHPATLASHSSVSVSAGLAPSRAKISRAAASGAAASGALPERHQAAPLAEQRLRLLVGHAEPVPAGRGVGELP